jgi:hypothetical protein
MALVLRTAAPAGWLPNYLAYVLLRFDRSEPGMPPAGTGPYVYRGEGPDGGVVLDAFAGHRDGKPAIDRVEFRVVTDLRRALLLLRRGEVHRARRARRRVGWRRPGRHLRTAVAGPPVMYLGLQRPRREEARRACADRSLRRATPSRSTAVRSSTRAEGHAEPIADFVPEIFRHAPALRGSAPARPGEAGCPGLLARARRPRAVLAYPLRQDARAGRGHRRQPA